MHAPSGVSASYQKERLTLPEDDSTVAPPPMSAYSIAVFSNNRKNIHNSIPDAHLESQESSFGPQSYGKFQENAALKESLKRKLSVHFHRSNTSNSSTSPTIGTKSPPSKSPAHLHTSTSTSVTSSHSLSGATGVTSVISHDANNSNMGGSSHDLGNPDSATLMHISGEVSNASTGTHSNHSMHSKSYNASHEEKSGHNSSVHEDGNERLQVSDARASESPSSKELSSFSSIPSRPASSGSSTKKSRIARRFAALGPPKRASEMGVSALVSQRAVSTDNDRYMAADHPSSPKHRIADLSTKEEALPKRMVSPDSDFFRSLKRLKEASPNHKDLARPRRPEPPVLRGEARPTVADKNVAPSDKLKQNHEHASLGMRQPLRDVSSGVFNSARGSSGFKKPKIPRPPVAEKITVPQDPTPQVPAKSVSREAMRPSSSRANEDRPKKIILVNSREYEKLDILGRGGSSKVYKVRSLSDKRSYALKKVSFDQFDESCIRGFKGEIDLLKKLKHEVRVVSLIDHAASSGSLYLLMECGDLDLAHVLQNKLASGAKLDPNFVRFHASEVFQCIQAVHNAGIVHSDLKPANFLFVGGILKIIDFGIANAVPEHTVNIYRSSQIGTPNYMAPEALVEINNTMSISTKTATTWRVGRPSDIWSCGCIIYQMFYGRPPYASYSGQQRIMAIMNPQVNVQYPDEGIGGVPVPSSAIELMKKCLERNPSERWTVEECLNCAFFKPKAVNEAFVKDLLHNAVVFGQMNPAPESIDDKMYDQLVNTILGQIKDLHIA